MKRVLPVFPDLIMLIVIFTGIFYGAVDGAILGLIAGFLRGVFSPSTFEADIFIFSFVGFMAAILASMFYKNRPLSQMFITGVLFFAVIYLQITFVSIKGENPISLHSAILAGWNMMVLTVVIAPVFFAIFAAALDIEEQ